VRILLDTHLFLWTLDDSPKLSRQARELMTASGNECFVSAVSFWEIAIKAALRRRDFRLNTAGLIAAADAAGLKHVPFVAAHAVHVARLPRHHPDPFDRALIAQAVLEPLTLLTHDATLERYGSAVHLV
jgi:PIN domain nuclease of toxin-antitoxin system